MMALQKLREAVALVALACLVAVPAAVYGQATGASLEGHVADASGAPTAGATVTVVLPSTGFTRTLTTQPDGSYRFASIPVGAYDVTASLAGFKTLRKSNVVLNVATGRTLDFGLEVATVEEAVTVTAGEAVVASEVSIGTVVSQKELENLPLNGRQFANLGVLAPGTSLSYNSDPTKPGQLVVALNGGSGRNVNYIIDGGDNTDDTIGGQLQNFSIEGVQEFKIQTQEYKAEYGRSTGGVLTVVGKSGTNELHGSAFGFLRNDSLNSTTTSEELAGGAKSDYSRKQFGGSVGGPIVKDKVFFFGTYEGTRRDTNYAQNTGGLIAGDGAAVPLAFKDDLVGGKLTANLTPRQLLQVRFGYQKNTDKYGASPLASPDSLGTVANKYHSILVGHSAQIGSGSVNELLFQYTKFDNVITPDSDGPAILYPNGAHSGQNLNTPQSTHQVKYQFKDDFAFAKTLGSQVHAFKVGVNFIHEPTLSGDSSVGIAAPQYTLLQSVVGSPIKEISQNSGSAGFATPTDQYRVYFQDDWHASKRLTLNIGVRYDLFTGFDLDQRNSPIWQTLSTQTSHDDPIYQPFQGGQGGVLSNDHNNVAPRVGLTYDLTGEGKKFLRGGYGIYYDFPYTNATILFPALAVQSNYGQFYDVIDPNGIKNADGSFYQIGQPLPPNQLPALAATPPNDVASPNLATPFSRQGSFGFSTELTPGFAIAVDAVNIQYRDLPYRSRGNPLANGARIFPAFGNFRIWSGNGKADYNGANFSIRAKISDRFTLQGFYTLSKITGNTLAGADEFRITNVNYQPDLGVARDNSVDPFNPLCDACIGPLDTDARHRVTLAGTYEFPYHILLSGVFRYRSATPYTVYAGVDLNGDGFVMDLPPGVTQVNSARGSSFSQVDLRLSKNFKVGKSGGIEILGEVFNLFNAENPAGFVGNQAASNFGLPTTYAGDPLQGEQRLAQLGLRLRF